MITNRIYILTYNDETFNIAKNKFHDKSWAKIISIHTTKYLENVMYDSWLLNNKDDWISYDYTGTLSWRSFQKIPIPNLEASDITEIITNTNPDVITFYNYPGSMLEQASYGHGSRFIKVWLYILRQLGFSDKEITDKNIPTFFSNYWMSKPEVMIDYISFFHKVKSVIENSPEIHDDLWSNANYATYVPRKRVFEIFNKPYHPLFIFILERMPCFFFYHKYKIMKFS